ncbi:hypothetical protein BOTBODRAFT_178654 [Botryobasidium botryosum FD-172 SS1]|uniref:Uncharacterized protein n=1 Tax=Botryobasidium botryosum (strain FD-172 SS1) TaxID=930990 RepID=A0A067M5E9_BOTB1|nr:hypothetical protein BOTBODRAFT_178654 [Botryobasidium botryosum FD-172 SS1]
MSLFPSGSVPPLAATLTISLPSTVLRYTSGLKSKNINVVLQSNRPPWRQVQRHHRRDRGQAINPSNGLNFHPEVELVLRAHANLNNQTTRALKLDLNPSLLPEKGAKDAVSNATREQPAVDIRAIFDFFKCPTFATDGGLLGGGPRTA